MIRDMTMLLKEPAYIQMEIQIFSATSMEKKFLETRL